MTRTAPPVRLATEFDDFLFALIGDDGNGMPLSVLSALVRLNLDPWQEAAELSRLPKDEAAHRLNLVITALPGQRDLRAAAARLIALLPRRIVLPGPPRATLFGIAMSTQFPARMHFIFFAITALLLAVLWMATRG